MWYGYTEFDSMKWLYGVLQYEVWLHMEYRSIKYGCMEYHSMRYGCMRMGVWEHTHSRLRAIS